MNIFSFEQSIMYELGDENEVTETEIGCKAYLPEQPKILANVHNERTSKRVPGTEVDQSVGIPRDLRYRQRAS